MIITRDEPCKLSIADFRSSLRELFPYATIHSCKEGTMQVYLSLGMLQDENPITIRIHRNCYTIDGMIFTTSAAALLYLVDPSAKYFPYTVSLFAAHPECLGRWEVVENGTRMVHITYTNGVVLDIYEDSSAYNYCILRYAGVARAVTRLFTEDEINFMIFYQKFS